MRVPAALALLCTTLALAACGGPDPQAYIDDVQRVQQRTEADARRVSAQMEQAQTPRQVAQRLGELGQAVRRNAAELDRIEAPDEVARQHDAYAELLTGYGNSLAEYARRVDGADASTINDLFDEAGTLTQEMSERERALITEINSRLQR